MNKSRKKIAIIGGGISGLAAACYASKRNKEVIILEKNETLGGRARQFKTEDGYVFDMGPSWYWMPDIMENYFNDFGYSTSDFFELIPLNPQFEIVFPTETIALPANFDEIVLLFEKIEKGAGNKLIEFMQVAEVKYEIGMNKFVNKPCLTPFEFCSFDIAKNALKLDLFTNFRSYVAKYFKHPYLKTIMEFPIIFLGASPNNIPALYSLMNYGGYKLGTFYPKGGFHELIKAMTKIAKENGVEIKTSTGIKSLNIEQGYINSISFNDVSLPVDEVISSADYSHTEQLLEEKFRNYSDDYWLQRTFAPSCLLFYLGVNEIIPNLTHHTLFFEEDLDQHIDEIYVDKQWPKSPLFYVCCPSKTDESVAPNGHENLFLLMPLAINLEDTDDLREQYFDIMIARIEKKTGISNLKSKINYKKSYCIKDFKNDYNAYGGNAYGLANTLRQTAILKPSIKNKKVKNLIYTGQLTVPGPGVPPSLISGKIAASLIKP